MEGPAEDIIHQGIISLENNAPKGYKLAVYKLLDEFSKTPLEKLVMLFKILPAQCQALGLSMESLYAGNHLVEGSKEFELSTEYFALVMSMALHTSTVQKPLEWWKNVSLLGIHVNVPPSTTIH